MFLLYWVVIAGGRRNIAACKMRAKMSFKAMCLSVPGNPCYTAAKWQDGGGSGEDDGAGGWYHCEQQQPALACPALAHQLESTNPGSRL